MKALLTILQVLFSLWVLFGVLRFLDGLIEPGKFILGLLGLLQAGVAVALFALTRGAAQRREQEKQSAPTT